MLCAPGPSWLSRRPPPTGLEGCGAPRAPATVVFKIQQCQGGCDRKAGEEASTPQESSAGTGNLGSRCQHPFQGSRHRSALCHVAIFVLLQRYVQHARMWIWAAELRSGLSCHAMSALSWLLSSESAADPPARARGQNPPGMARSATDDFFSFIWQLDHHRTRVARPHVQHARRRTCTACLFIAKRLHTALHHHAAPTALTTCVVPPRNKQASHAPGPPSSVRSSET